MVPAPQVQSFGTQHCEPVHSMPSPLQPLSMPATHCIGWSKQQYVPVHLCPFSVQDSLQPATHCDPAGTQHFLPVQCMPSPSQSSDKPLVHVDGVFTQHLSPVQKTPEPSQPLSVPEVHVHVVGTLHIFVKKSQDTSGFSGPHCPQWFHSPATSWVAAVSTIEASRCVFTFVTSIDVASSASHPSQISSSAKEARNAAENARPQANDNFTIAPIG